MKNHYDGSLLGFSFKQHHHHSLPHHQHIHHKINKFFFIKKIEFFLLTHHQNAQIRILRGDFNLIRGSLWGLRLNQGWRVQRRHDNVKNRLVEFELATPDWAMSARRLELEAATRTNLVMAAPRRLG